jgi:group I intron endonuclease
VYCIRNLINNKVYIGKANKIAGRIANHKYALRARNKKQENAHLIAAWNKYGEKNFDYFVLETIDINNQELLTDRELYWIKEYKSIQREFGYNLRMDSSSNMIVHEETRKKISEAVTGERNPNYNNKWSNTQKEEMSLKIKKQFETGRKKPTMETALKGIAIRNEKWQNNPELKLEMARKVAEKRNKFQIHQLTKEGDLIKIWENVLEIRTAYPEYKRHNIYAVCSGEKPSIYGYKWVKVSREDQL